MADPVRPLRLGTVIWFESLEFMSLGHEYDMVLLTPEPHRPTMSPRTGSLGAGDAQAAALVALAKRDMGRTTTTLCELRAARRAPPVSHAQLLAQGPWLGT